MAQYNAIVEWTRNGAVFTDRQYSRGHRWIFDEGVEVPASSSPHVVPLPRSVAAAVDPEEAFLASLSACHMLFFLDLAARGGFVVEVYRDGVVGELTKNTAGKLAMTRVTLRPKVTYAGDTHPSADEENAMHHRAHELCYIANSVTSEVLVEPVQD